MPHTRSIRWNLLLNVLSVVVLLAAGILGAMIFGTRRAVSTLSSEIVDRTVGQVSAKLDAFLAPATEGLDQLEGWADGGLLDPGAPSEAIGLLLPVLRSHPQVTALLIAGDSGRGVLVKRDTEGWECRAVSVGREGMEARYWRWTDEVPGEGTAPEPIGYDPRERPWWREAVRDGAKRVHWTEPYIFFTAQRPGITASRAIASRDRERLVVAVDILLDDLTAFTEGLRVGSGGVAFLLDDKGTLIARPEASRAGAAASARIPLLAKVSEIDVPVIRDAARELRGPAPRGVERGSEERRARRFESAGRTWWGKASRHPGSDHAPLFILVLIPESDLLGELQWMRTIVIIILSLVLIGTVVRAILLARRFSRPIERLVEESDRISQGDLKDPPALMTPLLEVQRLAQAHGRMRAGLRTLMKLERDLEIARRIQQGTFPRVIPQPEGYEIEGWNQPADATGGDTYDVVEAQDRHTGATRVAFMLADATGHGVGPCISVTQVRAMMRTALALGTTLAQLVNRINAQLITDLPDSHFVTAWFAVLDAKAHELRMFSGGQAPIFVYRRASGQVEQRDADVPPLGVVPDLSVEETPRVALEPGDAVLVVSDGILEASGDEGLFGAERVADVLRRCAPESMTRVMDEIRREVAEFSRGHGQSDDRTAVGIRRSAGSTGSAPS